MELRRDWEQGTYTIDTPRSQVATGWIGGRQISLADVEIALTTQNASVAVQSLDQSNISDAHAIQISLGARSIPDPRNPALMRSEPVTGRLTIRAIKGLKTLQAIRALNRSSRAPRHVRGWSISDQP